MKEALSFVICGYGHIGRKHAELIKNMHQSRLTAVVDVDEVKLNHAKDVFNVPVFKSLADFFLSDIKADVICICTPNGSHAAQAADCLHRGFHVVLEKPVALTSSQCELIAEAKAKSGCEVFCVMQNRFSPPVKWLSQIISEGKLGKPYVVQVNCFWNRDERYYIKDSWRGTLELDGGTLFTQFSHFIDLLIWLFGEMEAVSANFFNLTHQQFIEFEDSGNITLQIAGGGVVNFAYSTSVPNQNLESSITIIAENGSVKIGGQYMNQLDFCDIEGVNFPDLPGSNPANDYGPYKGSAFNHKYIFENVQDVLNGSSSIATPLEEGIAVVKLIEQIYSFKKSSQNLQAQSSI